MSGHSVQAIVSLKEERCGWPIVEAVTHSEVQGRMSVCPLACLIRALVFKNMLTRTFFPLGGFSLGEGGTLLRLSTMKRRKKSRETRFSSELAAAADRLREEGRATLVLGMDDFAAL